MDYVHDRFKKVQQKTGCSACDIVANKDFSEDWKMVRFQGTPAEVELAEAAVKMFMETGSCPLFHEQHRKRKLSVSSEITSQLWRMYGHPYCDGPYARMACILDVSIRSYEDKRRKNSIVSVEGSASDVTEAVAALDHLFTYYHNQYVMPHADHKELALPHGFPMDRLELLFGHHELKHIRRNWSVEVVLPSEHSRNNSIVIIGDTANRERVHAYMSTLLLEENQHVKMCQRLGWSAVERWGLSDEAYDFWGEEPDDEPWMSQYMYRRS